MLEETTKALACSLTKAHFGSVIMQRPSASNCEMKLKC